MTITTINKYNRIWGEKTLHPMVSVIDLSQSDKKDYNTFRIGFYLVMIEEYGRGHGVPGHQACDYSDGSVMFYSPGECVETGSSHCIPHRNGWMLAFHPDLVHHSNLGLNFDDYTFFCYKKEEALHISQREKRVFMRCLENISDELKRPIDKHSSVLLTKAIDLLLGYCKRFYDRQFILRSEDNTHRVAKTERIIYNYFRHKRAKAVGLLSASYCAGLLGLSPAYFNDLLINTTGRAFQEFVEVKRIEIAKAWLNEGEQSIAEIARLLGYSSTEYFCRLFKKLTGTMPGESKFSN